MTDMHYEDVSYGGSNFRLGVPKKNMVEYPATKEGKAFVAIEGKPVQGSKTPYREPSRNWETLFGRLAISAYVHHGKKDKYHEERFAMLEVTAEFLGYSNPPNKPYTALCVEGMTKAKMHPLEKKYREEVAEQKAVDELEALRNKHYVLKRKARERSIDLTKLEPPKTRKEYVYANSVIERLLAVIDTPVTGTTAKDPPMCKADMDKQMASLQVAIDECKSVAKAQAALAESEGKVFNGVDTGRMSFANNLPKMQNIPHPKQVTEVKDAAGSWVRVDDYVVFTHPECSDSAFKITGFGKCDNGEPGIRIAGRELLYNAKEMVRARLTDEKIGTVSGLTWVDKDQKEHYLQPGMLVTCPSYPMLQMRVTSIESGRNGDEGKGPKRLPSVCVVIFRDRSFVSVVRLSINDVTPVTQ